MSKADVARGYGNTPSTSALVEKRTLDKQVLVDWLSATFDFVKIEKISKNLYELKHDHNLQALLYMLGYTGSMAILKDGPGRYGYAHSITIGEHIELYYGSERAKNKHGNYTMQLEMNGKACREYENHLNGNFQKLKKFLISFDHTQFTRVDYAIDDFSATEFNIYDLTRIIESGHYVSAFKDVNMWRGLRNKTDMTINKGYTVQFGNRGSNMLVIYDKLLEQLDKEGKKANVDTWYRYEMRFVKEKARVVIENYITAVEEDDSQLFMTFASELLYTLLDLKIPSNNKQKTRWKTREDWLNFLEAVSKVDLKVRRRIESTIEQKKKYIKRSYDKFFATLWIALEKDETNLQKLLKEMLKDGISKIDDKALATINNYRRDHNLETVEDITDFIDMLDELDGDDEDD